MAKYIFVTGGVTSSSGQGDYSGFARKVVAGQGAKGNHSEV